MLADRQGQAHPAGHVRVVGLEGRGLGRVALHRGEPGPERGAQHQEADPARTGQPLARGAVDGVGGDVAVHLAQRLGDVDDQRHPGRPADPGHLDQRLDDGPVAGHHGQVHRGRGVGAQRAGQRLQVHPAQVVGREHLRLQAGVPDRGEVAVVLPGQHGHPGARGQLPGREEDAHRRGRALAERDVGRGQPDQPGEHRPALLQQRGRGLLGLVATDLGLVPGVVGDRVEHLHRLPAAGRGVQVHRGRAWAGGAPGGAELGVGQGAHQADGRAWAQRSEPRATESVECAGSPSKGSRETSTVPYSARSTPVGSG